MKSELPCGSLRTPQGVLATIPLKFYSGNAQVLLNRNMQINYSDSCIKGCLAMLYF